MPLAVRRGGLVCVLCPYRMVRATIFQMSGAAMTSSIACCSVSLSKLMHLHAVTAAGRYWLSCMAEGEGTAAAVGTQSHQGRVEQSSSDVSMVRVRGIGVSESIMSTGRGIADGWSVWLSRRSERTASSQRRRSDSVLDAVTARPHQRTDREPVETEKERQMQWQWQWQWAGTDREGEWRRTAQQTDQQKATARPAQQKATLGCSLTSPRK